MQKSGTPMELNFQAEQNQEDIKVPYRQLIGSLLYVATITRPDIIFPVSYLSRTLDKPTQATWKAAKRIVRYLMATKDIGLIYTVSSNNLISYSDSDWARDKINRKSTSGNIVLHGSNAVSWFFKKQGCVSLSTAEAEYVAAAASIQDLVHLKEINKDFSSFEDTTLLVDNKSAICMAKTFENSKRSKHIDIRTHYIEDLLAKDIIKIDYIEGCRNIADTKPLYKDMLNKFMKLSNMG
ncbi:hypothetical protein LAZ67_1006725 [Cordylochernes scorpioides]|uniref:Copia protein n=1 Tax=Cordylochernes scorpioides TaxID=51811 RepID=A0ABY6JZM5_9ARAC|nr:hypothetical protein LAZ67_1006725 [Cordylochernes scorpioides]